MYAESGSQVRGMNSLRNTTLSLVGVGVIAFLGLLAQAHTPSPRLWWGPLLFAAMGLSLHLLTYGYILKALERQRSIAIAYAPDRLKRVLGPEHFNPRVPWTLKSGWWDHRLDWAPALVYLVLMATSVAALLGWDATGLTGSQTATAIGR